MTPNNFNEDGEISITNQVANNPNVDSTSSVQNASLGISGNAGGVNSTETNEQSPILPLRVDLVKSLSGVFGGITEGEDSKLHTAARRGDAEETRRLLSGKPIKKRDIAGLNVLKKFPFLRFAHEKYEDEVTDAGLEASKKLLNCRNRLGATALWIAASLGHTETVEALCECGADLEIPDIKGQTPLLAASKYNKTECVSVLLKAGANPEGSTENICSPIHMAARSNYPNVLRLLIEYGADVNGKYSDTEENRGNNLYVGSVPLYMTIVYQNFECFRLLILNGAELHAASNERGFGRSLVTAVIRHQCDVKYLKLIALCGGIRHGDKKGIDDAINEFQNYVFGLASTRKECLQFLELWKARPMSLAQLCRITIRRQMGQQRLKNFINIDLPKQIHRYVLFSGHLKE
ncbi:ankyrin repeat and SOCS box protein 12-like isoform X1 [Styela clava]